MIMCLQGIEPRQQTGLYKHFLLSYNLQAGKSKEYVYLLSEDVGSWEVGANKMKLVWHGNMFLPWTNIPYFTISYFLVNESWEYVATKDHILIVMDINT